MNEKFKKDVALIFTIVFFMFLIILALAFFSSYSIEGASTFASGIVFGFLISQFLFLFFNKKNKRKKFTKRKYDNYWWNNGQPPNQI